MAWILVHRNRAISAICDRDYYCGPQKLRISETRFCNATLRFADCHGKSLAIAISSCDFHAENPFFPLTPFPGFFWSEKMEIPETPNPKNPWKRKEKHSQRARMIAKGKKQGDPESKEASKGGSGFCRNSGDWLWRGQIASD